MAFNLLIMDKLFIQVFGRVKTQLALPEGALSLQHIFTAVHQIHGMGFQVRYLTRIPDHEIRTMLKMPCPISQPRK